MRLIECVPNISEGTRRDVIDACARAVQDVGAALLDQHTDATHNRSVLTFAGPSEVVGAAALALAAAAVRLIDLRAHVGVHPRLGALDVVPFIPIVNTTIDDCVSLARQVGAEMARVHGLPVYLYEAAAASPSRRRLEDIRRGQFEGLAARMTSPDWRPDFGPSTPHPSAGATVVGARQLLVAYNINLATSQVDVARAIAATIRERSGGLPGVKALGLLVGDPPVAQVSMNLTDITRVTMPRVFETVVREAARLGVEVLESELVGLVPLAALGGAEGSTLRIRDFTSDCVLEHRLARAGLTP